MTYRLERRGTGELVTDLAGVRTTLTLSGSALFGETATEGLLISGGGTQRALVEFVGGLVTLPMHDATAEVVSLDGEDTERNDVAVTSVVFEDFEADDGGFTHFGNERPLAVGRADTRAPGLPTPAGRPGRRISRATIPTTAPPHSTPRRSRWARARPSSSGTGSRRSKATTGAGCRSRRMAARVGARSRSSRVTATAT